jgi:hypothetical protein
MDTRWVLLLSIAELFTLHKSVSLFDGVTNWWLYSVKDITDILFFLLQM